MPARKSTEQEITLAPGPHVLEIRVDGKIHLQRPGVHAVSFDQQDDHVSVRGSLKPQPSSDDAA